MRRGESEPKYGIFDTAGGSPLQRINDKGFVSRLSSPLSSRHEAFPPLPARNKRDHLPSRSDTDPRDFLYEDVFSEPLPTSPLGESEQPTPQAETKKVERRARIIDVPVIGYTEEFYSDAIPAHDFNIEHTYRPSRSLKQANTKY